jgi:hypothetical protein
VHVHGGTLTVTNEHHTARLIIGLNDGEGSFHLDGGTIVADFLQVTGKQSNRFVFKSGNVIPCGVSVTNGSAFTVGDGATLNLSAGCINHFSGGLIIAANGTVTGSGTIDGDVANYGTISAGQSDLTFAPLNYTSAVTNWGSMYMTNGGNLIFQGTVLDYAPAPIRTITPNQQGGGRTIWFSSIGGLKHILEYKNSLGDANWTPLGSTTGTGLAISLTDPAPTANARFYHIRVTQ